MNDAAPHFQLAARMAHIEAFEVMEIQTLARELEAQGRDVIHLEIGEPDFTTPRPIVEAAQRALDTKPMFYTSALGLLELRDREFVESARAIGAGKPRILFLHVLPNVIGPVIVLMTLNVANNILLESSLTFVGLGVDATIPSWGGMLADGRTYVQTAWWIGVFPGLAIMLTVLGLNLLGDWLRDHLDPARIRR